jgi:hypothetical protein
MNITEIILFALATAFFIALTSMLAIPIMVRRGWDRDMRNRAVTLINTLIVIVLFDIYMRPDTLTMLISGAGILVMNGISYITARRKTKVKS